jgi:hypothetical protein
MLVLPVLTKSKAKVGYPNTPDKSHVLSSISHKKLYWKAFGFAG